MRSSLTRDRLLHVVPGLNLGTALYSLMELPGLLPRYSHALLHTTPVQDCDIYAVMALQAAGFEVVQYDEINIAVIKAVPATGMILHDCANMPGIGQCLPSLYWSYDNCDLGTECLRYMACSEYKRQCMHVCHGVVRPLVNTRGLMQVAGSPGPLTVAIVYDDSTAAYPYQLMNHLLSLLPDDVTVLALKPRDITGLRQRRLVSLYPHMQGLATAMLAHADIVVCVDTASNFGYRCTQAMALGKLVLCPRHSFYAHEFKDRYHALFWDTAEDIARYVNWYRCSSATASIAANGKLWAGYADAGIEVGLLKSMLRSIGA